MSLEDELAGRAPPAALDARARDLLSVDELAARIVSLRAEIALCEDLIASKRASRSLAEALFSRPGE